MNNAYLIFKIDPGRKVSRLWSKSKYSKLTNFPIDSVVKLVDYDLNVIFLN